MRIGIFGGSFDPIHLGHLILAEQCREIARLDQVWFIPCAQQPLKDHQTIASDRQRCEMIELAIAGCDPFHLSKIEVERGGVSYMVDTLEQIHAQQPDDELFLLLGSDSLASFSRWKAPERICQLAIPIVVNRPQTEPIELSCLLEFADQERLNAISEAQFASRWIDISSSEIRQRVADQQSLRYLLPRAVEKYIETQKLYR